MIKNYSLARKKSAMKKGVNLKMCVAGHTAKQELTNLIFLLYLKNEPRIRLALKK